MDSGACARSMVCMPESMERTAAPSPLLREGITRGPGLLFTGLEARLFAFVLLFLSVFLGMVLLQQSGNCLQELVYLDRLVQHRNLVLPGVVRSFRRCVASEQDRRHAATACPRGLDHFKAGALFFKRQIT